MHSASWAGDGCPFPSPALFFAAESRIMGGSGITGAAPPHEPTPTLGNRRRGRSRFRTMPSTASAPPAPPPEPARPKRSRPTRTSGREVRAAFSIDRNIINFNNGYCQSRRRARCRTPCGACWSTPTWGRTTPWSRSWSGRWKPCGGVWRPAAGCDPEEMAITRNASESLENAQYGIDLKRGDEVLTTDQDYPRMLTTFGSASGAKASCSRRFRFRCRRPRWTICTSASSRPSRRKPS